MTGVDGALKDAAEQVLTMKPNFAYTFEEVSEDVEHIFRLGWFAKCNPSAEDTRDGMRLTIQVQTHSTASQGHPLDISVLPCCSVLSSPHSVALSCHRQGTYMSAAACFASPA